MKPLTLIGTLVLSMLCAIPVFAQDTLRVDSVVVTERPYQRTASVAQTTIDEATLEQIQPLHITEALRAVPGLFVQDYGGIGGLKTISIRGGSSAQSLTLLEGVRFNSAQNGQMDLSVIPASFLSSINVSKGALSALYGANALTGAVDLQMELPKQDRVRAFAEGGSFNTWRLAANGVSSIGDVRIGASFERYGSDGSFDYPITADNSEAFINRSNADVSATAGMIRTEVGRTSVMLIARDGERGIPGAVVTNGSISQRARFSDTDVLASGKMSIVTGSASDFSLGFGARYLDQTFTDPDSRITGSQGIDERFILRDVSVAPSWKLSSSTIDHTLTADLGFVDLRGGSLQPDVGDYVVRRNVGGSYRFQWQVSTDLEIDAALRYDWFSDAGSAASGFVGAAYRTSDIVTLRANVGTGFRPPSFNELYFLNYGTSDLEPERSLSATVGADVSPLNWLRWEVSGYVGRINNLIVSVPASPVVTSAQNVGEAQSVGLESNIVGAFFNNDLITTWSYTLQQVVDNTGRSGIDGTMIPYTPVEMIALTALYDNGTVLARGEWTYTSHRYAQPGGEYTSLLPSYALLNIGGGLHVYARDVKVDFILRLDNLLDERYEVIRGFPMPGRSVRLTMRVTS